MAQNERTERAALPPYLPYKTFANFLEGLHVGVPAQIDRSVMCSLSGTMQSWLLGALRYLGLTTDDNVPTERLQKLVKAKGPERQAILAEIAESSYGSVFKNGVNLQTATPRQLDDAFASIGAQGTTIKKCVGFFIALAKDAGLPLSHFLQRATRRQRASGPRPRRQSSPGSSVTNANGGSAEQTAGMSKTPYEVLFDILDPNEMSEDEQNAVWTLIRYLKKQTGA
jgi:hypothetical protein